MLRNLHSATLFACQIELRLVTFESCLAFRVTLFPTAPQIFLAAGEMIVAK
jgi:hypothetical protein